MHTTSMTLYRGISYGMIVHDIVYLAWLRPATWWHKVFSNMLFQADQNRILYKATKPQKILSGSPVIITIQVGQIAN